MTCQDCGACCFEQGGPSFCDEEDGDRTRRMNAPEAAREALADRRRTWRDNPDGPCCWFDEHTKRCRFYEYRPQICRDLKVGSEGCRSWRDEYNIDVGKLAAAEAAKGER